MKDDIRLTGEESENIKQEWLNGKNCTHDKLMSITANYQLRNVVEWLEKKRDHVYQLQSQTTPATSKWITESLAMKEYVFNSLIADIEAALKETTHGT